MYGHVRTKSIPSIRTFLGHRTKGDGALIPYVRVIAMAPLQQLMQLLFIAMAALGPGVDARPMRERTEDVAVELKNDNFNETLWAAPASFALVEFYAHWCPACRNYKPHYERVAKLFNGRNAAHPGIVFMAKVDCANEINIQLCGRFSVDHYPSLYWGPPGKIAWGGFPSKTDNGVEMIQTPRTAETLLEWINKRIGKTYALKDEIPETGSQSDVSEHVQAMLSLHDIEEATAQSYQLILQNKMLNTKNRGPFLHFLQLLAVHHPSKRCRKGAADILVNFEDIWLPAEDTMPNVDFLQRLHICGDRTRSGTWETCRGSVNGTRGYSCGLWLLFHALSVRVDDGESKAAMHTIREFVGNFFNCEDCRQHFMEISASSVNTVNSRRDVVTSLWRAHNEVNERVGKEEAKSGTGDPKFPKQQWPSTQICTACRSSSNKQENEKDPEWNEPAVYSFLMEYYGRAYNSVPEDRIVEGVLNDLKAEVDVPDDISSSRVAVPIGAAFGVAMASCGFGIVACFWRMQQKRRKLLRRRV